MHHTKTCERQLKTCLEEKLYPQMHVLEKVERHKINIFHSPQKVKRKKLKINPKRVEKRK